MARWRTGWWGVVVVAGAGAACSPRLKGTLRWIGDGSAVDIRSAYFVPTDHDSFRVYVSSTPRDCAWAKRSGIGSLEPGELSGSIDLAPVIALDGSAHWSVVGAGWNTESHARPVTSGNVGAVVWDAGVTSAAGCNRHITIDSHGDKKLQLHGDFEAVCCGPAPARAGAGPMNARLGKQTFPFTRASARPQKDGYAIRISRDLPDCTDDVTGADLFLDLQTDTAIRQVRSANASGLVIPAFGYGARDGAVALTIAKTGSPSPETLELNGTFASRPFGSFDGPALDVEVHGRVPITLCR